jgi:hypothetical protein
MPGKIMTNWQPLGSILRWGFGLMSWPRDRTGNDERNNVLHPMSDIVIAPEMVPGGGRTPTRLPSADFESAASASSAIVGFL